MPSPWHEQDDDTGGVRLHVRQLAGDGPPLILLHGLGVSGAVWQAFARRLVPAWSPIAPDLRGHGQSGQPQNGYAAADYASDIVSLMDVLRVPQAPVVGHSLGALVALALAAAAPERVPTLALLDPPLDAGRRNPDVEPVYRLRHAPPGELETYLARGSSSPLVARALAPLYRQAADAAFEAHLREVPGAPWAWEVAPSIGAPVLVLQADPALDGVLGDEAARDFVARLPQGRRLKLPGARHAVHASHPAQTAEAILRFLRGE
ncbi:MAG: alpha/beta fold hydrolase [Chloroflexota bacterium]